MTDDMTPREVAEELGVTVRTVQRWIADGRLPSVRVGSRVRVSRASLSVVADGRPPPARSRLGTLLIANRGEIARRVARSARRLGMRTIGVHAADEPVPTWVDEPHRIDSYLDGDALLDVAMRFGADAIHPGYGFLAENPAFARSVIDAGITWVGPPPDAIAAMGDKAAARRRAAALGIPTIAGYDGSSQDDAALIAAAERIGFPLLVKPSAGGGGKGMRVVHDPSGVAEALAAARREAARSFGDDRLILERFLAGPRHVEIQVLFDAHGNGSHLGERDCSAQRRNQKVMEEAPAPSVTPELRERMGAAALAVAGSVGYASAGTVEMLLTDAGEFFFLEMNTRLQVEHPVTEEVTGRDLVADQLRIAAGATLGELGVLDASPTDGHAIEARLYAEDPESGFLPSTGRIVRLGWPAGVRVDAGVDVGDAVTDRYDPMLAKLIVHGATRDEALDRLRSALAATTVLGVRTNLRFLRWLAQGTAMREGEMRTDTIDRLEVPAAPRPSDADWQAAARLLSAPDDGPWTGGWRLNSGWVRRLRQGDEERRVEHGLQADAEPVAVRDGETVHVGVEGRSMAFTLAPPPTVDDAVRHAATRSGGGASVLTAPMPGRIIAIRVREGAVVSAREPLIVIEAMKMEHAVIAPHDGTLGRLAVREGDQVQRGDVLGEVAPAA